MEIIQEFIEALSIEIDALKKGKGGSIITIYNGQLIRESQGLFIYQFTLENFLIALDDTPANIQVNGKEFDCDIVSVTGQKVQISVDQHFGDIIPSAKIKTNTWYLLERLKSKYEENIKAQFRFENSDKLFQQQSSKIDDGNFKASYSTNGETPNSSQKEAIESSINDFISIIWGPPGTGKTATIAKAIESHLNLDRKVLLLSHANNAVDQALIKVANQMRETYYKAGQLVRLGTPKAEMGKKIEDDCPLVLSEEIVKEKTVELNREKEDFNRKLETLHKRKQAFEHILSFHNQVKSFNEDLKKLKKELQLKESGIRAVNSQISQTHQKIDKEKKKLAKARESGAVKKFFLGLDPEKIETSIEKNVSFIRSKKTQAKELSEKKEKLEEEIKSLKSKKNKKEKELSEKLGTYNSTVEKVQNKLSQLVEEEISLQNQLGELNKAIEEIKTRVFNEAKLIATTLTKSYLAREIESIDFDILIVDEASMAPMPMLYWAASKVKKGITIVGDFNQLPPICIANDDLAQKWLARSIYDQLEITNVDRAKELTKLLQIQYRMHPAISEIPNKRMYGGLLEDDSSVENNLLHDSVSGKSGICLIDTSSHNPWCSQFEIGGRFNFINALICVSLAKKIAGSLKHHESIGIITPYRNQASLIQKIIEDTRVLKNVDIRVNTIHSFQGGDESVIIFDSLEGPGAKKWSMINEYDNTESAELLLNVALTRAEKKLYLIANRNYFRAEFDDSSWFRNILNHFTSKGKVIESTEILADLRDEKFEFWIEKLNSLKNRPENYGLQYNDEEFWPSFHNDLAHAKEELIIFSPFITKERFGKLHLIFTELLSKAVKIYLITLPPDQHPSVMENPTDVILKLRKMGVTVKFRHRMHEKIAIIDRKVEWSGSLNILSHNKAKEYMKRVEGENSAKELFNKFDLQEKLIEQNINGELCPICKYNEKVHFIVPKFSRRNNQFFYGCSGYRESNCRFSANIRTRSLDEIDINEKRKKSSNTARKNKNSKKTTETSKKQQKDLFGNSVEGRQWESKLCYWSSVKLPGYRYSKKKDAWWKRKK